MPTNKTNKNQTNTNDFFDFDKQAEETPVCRVIMISGPALSGKSTTVANVCRKVVFVSTDGNAKKQGFKALDFKLLPPKNEDETPVSQVWRSLMQPLIFLYKNKDKFDGIAFDLIEYYDELLQTIYSGSDNPFNAEFTKLNYDGWGNIKAFYLRLNTLLKNQFSDKVIFFISKQDDETDPKTGRVSLRPAIREKIVRLINSSLNMELVIDRDHTLEFAADYRFKGKPTNPVEAEVLDKVLSIMREQGTLDED